MDQLEFIGKYGFVPLQDDLERVNCIQNDVGHKLCGICDKHNKPRFMCGCLKELKKL